MFRGGGTNPKLIYENGEFKGGYALVRNLYYIGGHGYADGYIVNTVNGITLTTNVYTSPCKTISIDLSKFVGKSVYIQHILWNGVEHTEKLDISNTIKSLIIGTECGGGYDLTHRLTFALCNVEFTADGYAGDNIVSRQDYTRTSSAYNLLMTTIKKIWIA